MCTHENAVFQPSKSFLHFIQCILMTNGINSDTSDKWTNINRRPTYSRRFIDAALCEAAKLDSSIKRSSYYISHIALLRSRYLSLLSLFACVCTRGELLQHPCKDSRGKYRCDKYRLKICNRGLSSRSWLLCNEERKIWKTAFCAARLWRTDRCVERNNAEYFPT